MNTAAPVMIAGRPVGPGHPPYIVAEMSANHNGNMERALAIMAAAKKAGADAIKLQTYTADTMTIDCDRPEFRIQGGLWGGRTLYDLYKEAETPFEWHKTLFERGRELGITVFSTPFDESAVDLLERLDTPAYKIASFEAIDLPLVARVAATGKPMIISTGLASLGEIAETVDCARSNGCNALILLHCISAYPAPPEQCNLTTIPHLAQTFSVISGLSDHTLGTAIATAATALGACFIEKHFTLRRDDGGPDSAFSLEPTDLERLVTDVHDVWSALGHISYKRQDAELGNLTFRRSLYAVKAIAAGEPLTRDNVRSIRPGLGLPPKLMGYILGQTARVDIPRGTPLSMAMIESGSRE